MSTRLDRLYPVQFIGRDQGLPSTQVQDLSFDVRNVLVAVGPSGLVQVDGPNVRSFGRKEGLRSHGLRCVTTSRNRTWVGGDAGVDVIDERGNVVTNSTPWTLGIVEKIRVHSDGRVLVATATGLLSVHLDGTPHELDPDLVGCYLNQLTVSRSGAVWVSGPQLGLMIQNQHRWDVSDDERWPAVGKITSISVGPDDTMFVGGTGGAVQCDAAGRIIGLVHISSEKQTITSLCALDDELWVATGSSLYLAHRTQGGWTADDCIADNIFVKQMVSDELGAIWCATDSDGIAKISAVRRAIVRPIIPKVAATLCIRPDGENFFVGGNGTAWSVNLDSNPKRAEQPLFRDLAVWDVLRRSDGTIWAATQTGIFALDSGGELHHIGSDHPTLSTPGRFLLEHNGSVFVGSTGGLTELVLDGISVVSSKVHGDENGNSLGYCYSVQAENARLFIGTLGNGAWLFDKDACVRLVSDGLIATGNTPAITSHHGQIFISQDDRLVKVDSTGASRVIAVSEESVMGWALAHDLHGRLWVGSPSGLKLFNHDTGALVRNVLLWMGLAGWEFTTSRSLAVDIHGRLLCGLNSGFAIVDIDAMESLAQRPNMDLRSVRWIAANVRRVNDRDDSYEVDRGPWTVEVDVSSLCPVDGWPAMTRFYLQGFDSAWSAPSSSGSTRFSSLPVGTYELKAQAYTPFNGWDEVKTLLSFDVKPSAWRVADDPVHLAALLEDRARISRDLHDNVIQRLFATGMELNAVASIASPELSGPIQRSIDELERTIEELRRSVSALAVPSSTDGPDLWNEIVAISQRAEQISGLPVSTRITGTIDGVTPNHMRAEVLAVVRESLSNVVRHANATRAEIHAEVVDGYLRISVSDNGQGMPTAITSYDGPTISNPSLTGNGIRNLEVRAHELGGTLQISSSDSGTQLLWSVPLFTSDIVTTITTVT